MTMPVSPSSPFATSGRKGGIIRMWIANAFLASRQSRLVANERSCMVFFNGRSTLTRHFFHHVYTLVLKRERSSHGNDEAARRIFTTVLRALERRTKRDIATASYDVVNGRLNFVFLFLLGQFVSSAGLRYIDFRAILAIGVTSTLNAQLRDKESVIAGTTRTLRTDSATLKCQEKELVFSSFTR